jgi:hypothetical protein
MTVPGLTGAVFDNRERQVRKGHNMPRCDTCLRTLPSADVRKLPRREAYRCKDKFDCLLAQTNSDPYVITVAITVPAKSLREARGHADYFCSKAEVPMEIVSVVGPDGETVDANDIRAAVYRN